MILLKRFNIFYQHSKSVYYKWLINFPYLSQGIQTAVLMGTSDIIAQALIEKVPLRDLNLRRTTTFTGMGFILVGPTLRYWYGCLEKLITIKKPIQRLLYKVISDQLLFAPCFIVIFTTVLSYIQGMGSVEIYERLQRTYWDVLLRNYMIWPAAQIFNFAIVPLNFQVLFVQIVAIFWNCYLSLKLGSTEE